MSSVPNGGDKVERGEYFVTVNAMGNWSLVKNTSKPNVVEATFYSEGLAHQVCGLLNPTRRIK